MSLHRRFKHMLLGAVPRDWDVCTEYRGEHLDPCARWRADVYAWKDGCGVALEAQLADDGLVDRRSEAYLATGVWPLWFFARVPRALAECAVFTFEDAVRVPGLLEGLVKLPDPIGLRWQEAQERIRDVSAHATATTAPWQVDERTLKALRRSRQPQRNRYQEGYKAGWAAANYKFREALKSRIAG